MAAILVAQLNDACRCFAAEQNVAAFDVYVVAERFRQTRLRHVLGCRCYEWREKVVKPVAERQWTLIVDSVDKLPECRQYGGIVGGCLLKKAQKHK